MFYSSQPKHYLVTGGCGFIGSHLVDALIARGHAVSVLDNLSTGKRENLHPSADFHLGDTTDEATVEQALQGVDGCFHLAAIASVEQSNRQWVDTHRVNVTSTVNIFQAASRQRKKVPVVYTSSAAVYGDSATMPLAETAETRPLTAYGVDKLSCDLHGRVAWRVHRVPNIGLRPFNVYGPRQDPASPYSGVISIFMDRIRQNQSITIYGDGLQMRDFVYVSDVVKCFVSAMKLLKTAPEERLGHDEINLCTGRATSINELVQIAGKVLQKTPDYAHAPARQGDIRLSIGDPARLSARLGVRLQMTLPQGLTRMVDAQNLDGGDGTPHRPLRPVGRIFQPEVKAHPRGAASSDLLSRRMPNDTTNMAFLLSSLRRDKC